MTDENPGGLTIFPGDDAATGGAPRLWEPARPTPEFDARCRAALAVVQLDLDATGYGEFVIYPVNLLLGGEVEMWAALPDGAAWSGGGSGMTPEMDDEALLWHAASSVSDTLLEVRHDVWPRCRVHDYPMSPPHRGQAPDGLINGRVWWWCPRADHAVAPVGRLDQSGAVAREE